MLPGLPGFYGRAGDRLVAPVGTLAGALVPGPATPEVSVASRLQPFGLHGLQAERVPHGRGAGEAPWIGGQESVQAFPEPFDHQVTGRAAGW